TKAHEGRQKKTGRAGPDKLARPRFLWLLRVPSCSSRMNNTMKILVANLGSTSFKYRLFNMEDERILARGGVERIGSEQARAYAEAGAARGDTTLAIPDHGAAVKLCLQQLSGPPLNCLKDPAELAAIAFKA